MKPFFNDKHRFDPVIQKTGIVMYPIKGTAYHQIIVNVEEIIASIHGRTRFKKGEKVRIIGIRLAGVYHAVAN